MVRFSYYCSYKFKNYTLELVSYSDNVFRIELYKKGFLFNSLLFERTFELKDSEKTMLVEWLREIVGKDKEFFEFFNNSLKTHLKNTEIRYKDYSHTVNEIKDIAFNEIP